MTPPAKIQKLKESYSSGKRLSINIECNANAHNITKKSCKISQKVEYFFDFIFAASLKIAIPTFVTKSREQVSDIAISNTNGKKLESYNT